MTDLKPDLVHAPSESAVSRPGVVEHRIAGLDSLRIVLALIVAFSHGFGIDFQLFLNRETALSSGLGSAAWVLAGNLYNGQAAVIVFFLVSGFVIHYPYAKGRPFEAGGFLTARLLRIGLPLAVVLIVAGWLFKVPPLGYAGIWSLICELVYYFLYPGLRVLRRLAGSWLPVYLLAAASASMVLWTVGLPPASDPGRLQDFQAFGPSLTWLIGLPIWLLGCLAAETDWRRFRGARTLPQLWMLRLAVFVLSILFSVLKFHGDRIFGVNLPNYISLHIFALVAFQWMRWEILWHFEHRPVRWLEWGGQWSYSLYIVHPMVHYLLQRGGSEPTALSTVWAGLLATLGVCVTAFVFFRFIELPSHRLAKAAAKAVQGLSGLAPPRVDLR